jgi:hypothetical protein
MRHIGSISSVTPYTAVAVGFIAGAAATWLLGSALLARREYSDQPVSDAVLIERVRERVADLVADPDAIQISVDDGVIRLAGELPYAERDVLLSELIYLPGVRRIRNALDATT